MRTNFFNRGAQRNSREQCGVFGSLCAPAVARSRAAAVARALLQIDSPVLSVTEENPSSELKDLLFRVLSAR